MLPPPYWGLGFCVKASPPTSCILRRNPHSLTSLPAPVRYSWASSICSIFVIVKNDAVLVFTLREPTFKRVLDFAVGEVWALLCCSRNLKGGDCAPHRLRSGRLLSLLRKAGSLEGGGLTPAVLRPWLCSRAAPGHSSQLPLLQTLHCKVKEKRSECILSLISVSLWPFGGSLPCGISSY